MIPESRYKELISDPEFSITPIFQGIYSTKTLQVKAYEALARSSKGSPAHLFATAKKQGQTLELDLECLKQACKTFRQKAPLFVNILPETAIWMAQRPNFFVSLLNTFPSPEYLVLELTETEKIKKHRELIKAINDLRSYGARLSLDDMADGYNRLSLFVELNPDFCKLNGALIRGCNRSKEKQELLRAFAHFSHIRCVPITETVETKAELNAICGTGISFAQGFYFNGIK